MHQQADVFDAVGFCKRLKEESRVLKTQSTKNEHRGASLRLAIAAERAAQQSESGINVGKRRF